MSGKSQAWGVGQFLPQRPLSVGRCFKVLLKVQPLELRWLGLENKKKKTTGCPVNFEFQTNNEYFLAEVCHILVSVCTKKSICCLSKINIKLKDSMFSLANLPGVKLPWLQYQVDDYITVRPWAS